MDWTAVAAVGSVMTTACLGLLTWRRGSKADEALNTATNVQTTFTAQKELVDNLQEEVIRQREDLNEYRSLLGKCEQDCRTCRSNLAGAHLIIAQQEAEIENLKGVVAEHEMTIAKHERTLGKISRRSDMAVERRPGEERRKSDG